MLLARLKRRFPVEETTRRVLRGMTTLASGSVAAKLIKLLTLPVITRLYAPEDIGALAVFAALVLLLVPAVTMQYSRGLPIAAGDAAAMNLLAVAATCSLLLSLILGAVLALGASPLLHMLSMQALLPFWWMLPLGALCGGSYLTLQLWATRKRSFRGMAGAEIAKGASASLGKIALFFFLPGAFALILASVMSQIGAVGVLAAQLRQDLRRLARHITLRRMRAMAWRHRSFPTFRLPSHLTLLMASKMPVFYLAAGHGPATAGQFGLAMLALSAPMTLIGRSMGKAFFGEAARIDRATPAALRRTVVSVTRILAGIGLLITAAIMLGAPALFPLIFGAQWAEAGQLAAVLSLFLTGQFVSAPVMSTLSVIKREDIYLQVNLQRLALAGSVFFFAYQLELSAMNTVLTYSIVLTLHYALTFWRVYRSIPNA